MDPEQQTHLSPFPLSAAALTRTGEGNNVLYVVVCQMYVQIMAKHFIVHFQDSSFPDISICIASLHFFNKCWSAFLFVCTDLTALSRYHYHKLQALTKSLCLTCLSRSTETSISKMELSVDSLHSQDLMLTPAVVLPTRENNQAKKTSQDQCGQ